MIQGSILQYEESTYYQIQDIELSNQIVLKRAKQNNQKLLKNEYQILKKLQNKEGFPALKTCEFAESGQVKSISIQKLNTSLKTIIANSIASDVSLPINFIINIGLQMLDRVQTLHQAGYLHMDLKPQHFLFENNDPQSCLYLIDFGLSIKIIQSQKTGEQDAIRQYFRGNITYSSLNRMKCLPQTRRDDLESLLYIIGEMIEGQLPWKPKDINNQEKKSWKALFSRVLSKKIRKSGWNKYGAWINQTLNKIRTKQDPYYQFRSNICKLVDMDL